LVSQDAIHGNANNPSGRVEVDHTVYSGSRLHREVEILPATFRCKTFPLIIAAKLALSEVLPDTSLARGAMADYVLPSRNGELRKTEREIL
jgi:hypothetical protein